MPGLAVAAAAALAVAVAVWWYGRREEKVPGRGPAAVLRGAAVFLFLSAPWLPPLRGASDPIPPVAVLVDHSLSMRYPVDSAAATTRMRAAIEVAGGLERQGRSPSMWSFAGSATPIAADELGELEASGLETTVAGAIERARASGADSVVIVTDGELADREAARRLAQRLGVALHEVRVARETERIGIRSVASPRVLAAGDTLEVRAEIVAAAGRRDSVRVTLDFGPGELDQAIVEVPADGRSVEAVFRVPAAADSDSTEWRPFDVTVEGSALPWDSSGRARSWVGISPEPTGAVMISVDPDWETRYLLPILDRSVPGGARGYLRVADGTWVRSGPDPQGGVPEASVRRAAQSATLLVVQGDPGDLPEWLELAARQRPGVMHLVRGTGPVAGTGVSVREVLAGEWYVQTPPPPGPASAHMMGVDAQDLPPLSRLFGSAGGVGGPVLSGQLDRRGPSRPVALLGPEGDRRWAVVQAEGAWRWAARGDEGLALYRGLYAGMVRWLVERTAPQPIQLSDPYMRAGDSLQWRVAPEVRDLAVQLEDASGDVVWSSSPSDSATRIMGPPLGRGDARFIATGTTRGNPFRIARPFHVNARLEEMPNPVGPALDVGHDAAASGRTAPGSDPPVWPFVAAIVLLCVEWLWRRKIGLR
ncbi:MAG: hypothetical protein M8861_10505 [marine benthic group bacterium]|nr:hypothetical protein [Gemmatimonadota bacterium]